jgi:hypothetical protein
MVNLRVSVMNRRRTQPHNPCVPPLVNGPSNYATKAYL